ncbi:putative lipoprotein [Leptospira ryugenii]|uniref:Putative lipoprotein n=1 Tax=Leptospira ryugenii TaxID=1917863 RepID=A0A2P2DXI9_9LEPT|nr:putative lipoprotein [Leptospira ryugenii]
MQIPPILVSATKNTNGTFNVNVRATNPELIFSGYRLYLATTENDARNSGDLNAGADCTLSAGSLVVLPVQPRDYVFLIDPSENTIAAGSGIDCKFKVQGNTGNFIAVRALSLSIQVQSGSSTIQVSGPSNAIQLP